LYAKRIFTPRFAASAIAPVTISFASSARLKSYCARSSDFVAPARKAATVRATSCGCWPPSVRVWISMRSLIDRLVVARIGQTTNFYRHGTGAAERRERLAAYLDARRGAGILLVGEAPGYRGARVSGIPFTSERLLTGEGPAEATATIVHRVLAELGAGEDVLLWNVVPTHPGTTTSNRAPTREEIAAARPFLDAVTRGRDVVAVGRVAAAALDAPYVRHPSHGGGAAFADGVRRMLGT